MIKLRRCSARPTQGIAGLPTHRPKPRANFGPNFGPKNAGTRGN